MEKAASWKSPKGRTFPLRLKILQQRQDFHFSHRPDDEWPGFAQGISACSVQRHRLDNVKSPSHSQSAA